MDAINAKQSPIIDKELEEYLPRVKLTATMDGDSAYSTADIVLIATPTNYDPVQNCFNTSSVEGVIQQVINANPDAAIIIKSTVLVGFTEFARAKYKCDNILFSPEFLREGRALYVNLYPSRIIVGVPVENKRLERIADSYASLMKSGAVNTDIPVLYMKPTEAEAMKLFANSYLAL